MLPRRQRSRATHSRPIADVFAMADERSIREQIAGTSANRSSPSRRRRNSRTRLRAAAAWLIVQAGCARRRGPTRVLPRADDDRTAGCSRHGALLSVRTSTGHTLLPERAATRMLWRLQQHPGPAQCPIYRGCQQAGPSLTGHPAVFSLPACCRQNKKRDTPLVMTRADAKEEGSSPGGLLLRLEIGTVSTPSHDFSPSPAGLRALARPAGRENNHDNSNDEQECACASGSALR